MMLKNFPTKTDSSSLPELPTLKQVTPVNFQNLSRTNMIPLNLMRQNLKDRKYINLIEKKANEQKIANFLKRTGDKEVAKLVTLFAHKSDQETTDLVSILTKNRLNSSVPQKINQKVIKMIEDQIKAKATRHVRLELPQIQSQKLKALTLLPTPIIRGRQNALNSSSTGARLIDVH